MPPIKAVSYAMLAVAMVVALQGDRPLLLLAVCPLSMLVMMRSMGSHEARDSLADAAEQNPGALRSELAALARQQTRFTVQLEALEDRDRRGARPPRLSPDPDPAAKPARRITRRRQGQSQT